MNINLQWIKQFISESELTTALEKAEIANKHLEMGAGIATEFTGFLKPQCITDEELKLCKEYAEELRNNSDVVLVIGIGGSYLGAKAVSDFLRKKEKILFVGNTTSGAEYEYIRDNTLKGKDFSIIAISKSGRTMEPKIALGFFYDLLKEKYGEKSDSRVIGITNPKGGELRREADDRGWRTLSIPDDLQGRYSVLTPCGLFPLAVAGADIQALVDGYADFDTFDMSNAICYGAARQALLSKGYTVEALCVWEPNLRSIGAWQQQLFAESEGKDGKGIFPTTLEYPADLHSVGQYMQQGQKFLFETMLHGNSGSSIVVPFSEKDYGGFNLIAGQTFDQVTAMERRAVIDAHVSGGMPVIDFEIGELNAHNMGKTLKLFMRACGISGYIQGINPFNQPGVEFYKDNMMALFKSLPKEEIK